MKKLLALLVLMLLPGCVIYDVPAAYERQFGCIEICDSNGCFEQCDVSYYYEPDGGIVYYDRYFHMWIAPTRYYIDGVWYVGRPHGYTEYHNWHYHPGYYYRGHEWHGRYRR